MSKEADEMQTEYSKDGRYKCTGCGEVYGYAYATCPGCGAKCEALRADGGEKTKRADAPLPQTNDEEGDLTTRERVFVEGVRRLLVKGALTDDDRDFLKVLADELGIYVLRRDTLIDRVWDADRPENTKGRGVQFPKKMDDRAGNQVPICMPQAQTAWTSKTIWLPRGARMIFNWCPPGSFMRGGHRVTLTKGFWLGKYPVTQKQWSRVKMDNPSYFKGDENPVECVDYYDCKDFIMKVNDALTCGMRLPTEAEWEYACRAGTTGAFGGTGALETMGWYKGNSCGTTHPVGMKSSNHWGFHDMHGNVLEWCADRSAGYGSRDVTDPVGPSSGSHCVCRGGSWGSDAHYCRSDTRESLYAYAKRYMVGFRVALDA